MDEIIITQAELPALNRERFAEELEELLGVAIAISAEMERGALIEAHITRVDGALFTKGQIAAVFEAAVQHDPTQLSAAQAIEKDRGSQRQSAAKILNQYDPAGLVNAVDAADSFDALRDASGQLAYLVAALAMIIRTQAS